VFNIAIMNVKGIIYMLAITAATASIVQAGYAEASAELPIWILLFVGSLVASFFPLKDVPGISLP